MLKCTSCSRFFLLGFAALFSTACSKVTVKPLGGNTYSLKCFYSREKCDEKVKELCRGEDKVSNVISRKESFKNSFVILPFGFVTTKRPVQSLVVECVAWKAPQKVETISTVTIEELPSAELDTSTAPNFDMMKN